MDLALRMPGAEKGDQGGGGVGRMWHKEAIWKCDTPLHWAEISFSAGLFMGGEEGAGHTWRKRSGRNSQAGLLD